MSTTIEDRTVPGLGNLKAEVPSDLRIDEEMATDDRHWDFISQQHGHKGVSWDSKKPIEVSAARILWESSLASGLEAYRVDAHGEPKGKKLTEFDPNLEHVVFMPMKAMVGG